MPRSTPTKDMTCQEIRQVIKLSATAFAIVAFAWVMFVMLHAI